MPADTSPTMELCVLLWEQPFPDRHSQWSLPGGWLRDDEDITQSITRQLAEKVDVRSLSHLEQLQVFSAPDRRPDGRVVVCSFMGLVSTTASPSLPRDTRWVALTQLPELIADHGEIIKVAHDRLVSKLGYTNLGFALSPDTFTISHLREIYEAALGYRVDPTNLQRTLQRRGVIEPTGDMSLPGPEGGRPARLYTFCDNRCEVTDMKAMLRPPIACASTNDEAADASLQRIRPLRQHPDN